ncbi:MAG: efflux RND transporter periplasmic adaptor subunit [Ginsengibacter sp.]
MQKITTAGLLTGIMLFIISCGNGKKSNDSAITDRKVALEKLKIERSKTDDEIKKLEDDLAKIDTSTANAQKAKLVDIQTLQPAGFNHYIELQGRIDAENISYIAPHGAPGVVTAVYVKKGDHVRKGQLLLKLDDAIARQNVTTYRQSMSSVRTQLGLAQTVYQRQKNLWDQNIGTEVQLLQAKSNAEGLENQLKTMQESLKTVQEQLNQSNIYSNVNGVADDVNIRVGETFAGVTAQGPQIKIVNNSSLKVLATIPENYLNQVKAGTDVIVEVPDINRTFNSKVSFVGSAIDVNNRGFVVEAKLPLDANLKPNQVALLKIRDYQSGAALAVPLATLQNDEKGKFVMIAATQNGKLFAHKRMVNIGFLSGDMLEIKTGLHVGDTLITQGFQSLYDGQLIATD